MQSHWNSTTQKSIVLLCIAVFSKLIPYGCRSSTAVMLRVYKQHNFSKGRVAFCTLLCQHLLLLPAVTSLWAPQGSELVAVTPGEASSAFSGFGLSPHIMLFFTIHNIASTYSHSNISTMASCLSPYLLLLVILHAHFAPYSLASDVFNS